MYENFAEDYATHAATGAYNALYDRPAILSMLGDVTGRTILDAACGPGLYAEELTRRGAHVIGFDQSPAMVTLARRRLGPAADLRVHDLTEPLHWLDDARVDIILALNYVNDRVAMLREFHRVLSPQGALVVSTTHPTSDWQRLGGSYFDQERIEESLHPDKNWPITATRRPLTTTCQEFRQAGFLIEQLLEPRPVDEMARTFPDTYTRLEQAPAFIAFRLIPTTAR